MSRRISFSSLPESYHLDKVAWQLFGTATVRYPSGFARILKKIIATIRRVCRVYSRKYAEQIMLFARFERGAESLHAHFLIAGVPEKYGPEYFAADFTRQWERHGGGNCKVDPYDPARDGVGYTTKSADTDEDRDLANPSMSPALVRHLKERAS